jgi:predicted nucleic acid-binding protein
MIGVTLDAGALIALERSDRRVIALLARAAATDATVTVPASVLAQTIRDPARQALTSRLIRQPNTRVPALDGGAAVQVGRLLAASRTSDVVDAHVVLCAREADDSIVTTDPQDLARLDPDARLIVL